MDGVWGQPWSRDMTRSSRDVARSGTESIRHQAALGVDPGLHFHLEELSLYSLYLTVTMTATS